VDPVDPDPDSDPQHWDSADQNQCGSGSITLPKSIPLFQSSLHNEYEPVFFSFLMPHAAAVPHLESKKIEKIKYKRKKAAVSVGSICVKNYFTLAK
jgi:hypothetical protein